MAWRECENCGTKMPFGRRRMRDAKGEPLLCNGCAVNGKGPGEGRPVGHHGARTASLDIRCDRCDIKFDVVGNTYTKEDLVCPKCGLDDELHLDESHFIWATKTAALRDPIRALAMQFVAHDSGDGETIYHCPFCGGGQVTGRSDGTVECGYCQNAFTVQIQPVHPGAPQTINGEPVEWPGQPEGTFQPEREASPGAETGAETTAPAEAPGGAPAPAEEEPKGKVPPQFASARFVTQAGHVVDVDAFQRHLAIRYADDQQAVLAEVRAERR